MSVLNLEREDLIKRIFPKRYATMIIKIDRNNYINRKLLLTVNSEYRKLFRYETIHNRNKENNKPKTIERLRYIPGGFYNYRRYNPKVSCGQEYIRNPPKYKWGNHPGDPILPDSYFYVKKIDLFVIYVM